jgi:hypothetical protein
VSGSGIVGRTSHGGGREGEGEGSLLMPPPAPQTRSRVCVARMLCRHAKLDRKDGAKKRKIKTASHQNSMWWKRWRRNLSVMGLERTKFLYPTSFVLGRAGAAAGGASVAIVRGCCNACANENNDTSPRFPAKAPSTSAIIGFKRRGLFWQKKYRRQFASTLITARHSAPSVRRFQS